MPGRSPLPGAILQLSGNSGHRKINQNEPKPESRAKCPTWLKDEGRQEWRRLASELDYLGLLTNLDTTALALYCDASQPRGFTEIDPRMDPSINEPKTRLVDRLGG